MEFGYVFLINIIISLIGYIIVLHLIPKFLKIFISANLFGKDMNKKNEKKVPEGLGVLSGAVFLICMFFFIPIAFLKAGNAGEYDFVQREFIQYLSALLAISCMMLFGFADDVLNLKWRLKLMLPAVAALPLLMVYYTNIGNTSVLVPLPLKGLIGKEVTLGPLYYVYMFMLTVFCTNAINILSGINGLEAGQCVIICLSVIIHNLMELSGPVASYHKFSLFFMLPFLGTTLALLRYNWYPATIFVGDTFCYTAGMTFAVVGILGHFSKTMLLFFIPQIINFLYSVPQLFHIIPCPRHRLPKFSPTTELVGMSKCRFKPSDIRPFASKLLDIMETFKLIHIERTMIDNEHVIEINNFTLNNFILKVFGPMRENNLTLLLLIFQFACSLLAFYIRYSIATYLYGDGAVAVVASNADAGGCLSGSSVTDAVFCGNPTAEEVVATTAVTTTVPPEPAAGEA